MKCSKMFQNLLIWHETIIIKKLQGFSYHINEIERFGEHIPLISEECEFDHFHEFEFINTKKTVNAIPHPLLIGLCSH